VRLAYLGTRYRTQTDLTWEAVAAADTQLSRWRRRVAEWAEAPSAAPPADRVEAVAQAFEADLDTPRALQELRHLERDDAVAPGAKFEAFALLDRLFGLDLVRDVGRPTEPEPLPSGAADLLSARETARASRDWAESDRLRDALSELGVLVRDTPDGQTWTVETPPR
jgi:cysteinyl-tRNA synthetase